MNNDTIRIFLLLLGVTLLSFPLSAQLSELAEDADVTAFEEQLETYMTSTRNDRSRDSYANFTGTLYGGGLTPEQQRTVQKTAVALARANARAESGMADYLDILGFLAGKEKEKQELFAGFHEVLTTSLADPAFTPASLTSLLNNSFNYLSRGRLDARADAYGWKVAGGKPSFVYDGGPRLIVDEVTQLQGSIATDSINIQETRIIVDLANSTYVGKGGRTDWQRVGLPGDVFVRLVDYRIDPQRNHLTSDSAHLQYPTYFGDRIIYGTFEDRLQSGGPRAAGDVPEFVSDNPMLTADNIGEGMRMRGRFELHGARAYATTEAEGESRVFFEVTGEDGNHRMRAQATQFVVIPGERLTGQKVQVALYFGQDSLVHPSASIDVDIPESLVKLKRTTSSSDAAPFYHSKNRFDIDADNINVYLRGDSAVVGRKTVSFQEKGDVAFTSENYFDHRDYLRIKALAGFHPLELIYRYRYQMAFGSDTLSANALANYFQEGLTAKSIESALFDLQERGFLSYDREKDRVILQPKLAHYVESEKEAKDYDKLKIVSRTEELNAYLDLKAGTILVEGVQPIQLNAKKQVAIRPFAEQVAIVGDRNLDFGGQVYAGGAILSGSDFHFRYEPYYIQFDSVKYIDLFLPEGGEIKDGVRRLSTASRIENVSGYVLLDAPKNKSGSEDIGYFPSIQTRGPSYIYYDKADTASLYSRDSFYFELAPFSLNNLDSLTETGLGLKGELVSGGIFPRMERTLSIQEDGSLGFVTTTDSLGQMAYGDRGNYRGQVTLNNGGLVGNGTFSYLEAEITSPEIRFGVDSATTTAQSFVLQQSDDPARPVPQVEGQEVDVTFRPYGDSLVVTPREGGTFAIFGTGDHTFDGPLVLQPKALRGGGTLDWSQASVTSADFRFGAQSVGVDTALVNIKSLADDGSIALTTSDVNAQFDFATGSAEFRNNGTAQVTELPFIQFKTSSDRFSWDMAAGDITFNTEEGKDRFTSINPDQDTLTFTGNSAVYDNLAGQLEVGGVPYIVSADARIIPGDSAVVVGSGGKVAQLTNARIIADTLNQYHVIERATVDIAGRKEYTASGFYQYNVGDHQQEFELQNIVGTRVGKGLMSEKATATRAQGEIDEETAFYIDDKTRFYGTIELDAGSKELAFDGYARIESEKLPAAEWFVVQSEGDKNNLVLQTEGVLDPSAKPLYTGFYLSKPDRHVYPALIQTPDRRVDHPILDAAGVFTYDEDRDAFLFGDSTRINDPSSHDGNLMIFDQESGIVSGDGALGIGGRLKYISMKSYGTISMELPTQYAPEPEDEFALSEEESNTADTTDAEDEPETLTDNMFLLEEEAEDAPATDVTELSLTVAAPAEEQYPETNVEMMAAIDLILPGPLLSIMANDIVSGAYSAPQLAINQKVPFATAGITTLFPAGPDRERAIAGLTADAMDLPPAINRHTFLFSDMKMRWNTDYQSFVSTQPMNGLASVAGRPVSRRFESYLEVKMTTGGDDRLYLFLKSPSETYYFFGFKDGILNVVSNNNAFMNELRDTKPKDLVLEMPDGQTYELLEVTPGTAQTFLRRVQAAFGNQN
ncbi:hypothetical protein GGR26_001136 [Lewinella marina]|uniref:Uncharacterized protein n=1 Tax=Neolewinella marina TaxID=438751 RepID=A0A2G0CHP9_9BACT|nr:hypothetical protein [Neolewinella marina]NJB85391.1 hypothetical protein [Neolewinella marina]PHK99496.1 hypothetical protein CGL56_00090 [Neolewinella marina]